MNLSPHLKKTQMENDLLFIIQNCPLALLKVYGLEDLLQPPAMTTEEIVSLIKQVNRQPVERDTLYNVVQEY